MKTLALIFASAASAATLFADGGAGDCAASFWFKLDAVPAKKTQLGYGFRADAWAPYPEGGIRFSACARPGAMGARRYVAIVEDACATGAWHHAAYSYSLSRNEFRVWFDGRPQGLFHPCGTDQKTLDAAARSGHEAGAPGAYFGERTWKSAPDEREMLTSAVPEGELAASARDFIAAAKAAKNAAFAEACRNAAQRLKAFERGGDMREYFRLQRFRRDLAKLAAWSEGAPESSAVLPVAIPSFSGLKHVPYRRPGDGRALKALEVAAARGEIDCVTFCALPYGDVAAFDVKPSDLKGPGGARIAASAVDVRVVSAWYETRWGWDSYQGGAREYPVRTPELLLHDDAMMKVDVATRLNMLRISDPEGDRYVPVSERLEAATAEIFDCNAEPVHDAPSFRPLALEEGEWRQFWITVRVPGDVPGGEYAGTLALTADGRDAGALPLKLTVHPFRLPRAATHYNIDRPMLGTWMHHCHIADKLMTRDGKYGSFDLANSLRRLENEYRNMAEHNMVNPWARCVGDVGEWTVAVMKRAGCETRPFFGGPKISWDFAIMSIYPPSLGADISVEGNFVMWQKEMADYTNTARTAMAEVEKVLGHRDIYSYAYDEGGDEFIRRDMPFFATLNTFGGKTFVTGGSPHGMAFMVDLNDASGAPGAERTLHWHEGGAMLETYAAPHSGPENPDIWRRGKGLALWYADLDGINEYNWYEGRHIWNEFLDGPGSEYRNFCIVYPTADGVVDTVAWEGQREGFDDIRYLTLLKRLARAAMRSGKAGLVKSGRETGAWIEVLDWRKGDLDALRLEAARRIVALGDDLRKAGIDPEQAGGALPIGPEKVEIALPAPQAGAPAKELAATGEAYGKRGMCDIAETFHRAAAEAAKADDPAFAADQLLRAGAAAVKRRDLKSAAKDYADAAAVEKAPPAYAIRARLAAALLPLSINGYARRMPVEAIRTAEKAMKAFAPHEQRLLPPEEIAVAKLRIVDAYRGAGELDAAAELAQDVLSLKDLAGGLRFHALESAAETEFARKRYKQAADYFRAAGGCDKASLGRMLGREAEAANAGGDYVRAMDAYSNALKLINPKEPAQKPAYDMMVGRISAMSKLIRKNTKVKSQEEVFESSDDPLSLDE